MSLLNALLGYTPGHSHIMALLGADPERVPRYRDAFVHQDHIWVMTRTGGGNREAYAAGNDYLRTLPGFVDDDDCVFDNTFAVFRYALPERFAAVLRAIAIGEADLPWNRFAAMMDKLKNDPDSPEAQHAFKVGEALLKPLTDMIKGTHGGREPGN